MDRLRRTLSFRSRKKKRKHQTESTKPPQWQEDEKKVREGTCSFQVKYLGCAEVFESRGMQVCEEAHKLLRHNAKKSHRLSFRRKKKKSQKAVQAILYISGDSLRVVEDRAGIVTTDDGQGLIVDQTIEKVSFCAPDREHEKGFSYICRDGTTKRWMCHGFLALKESGERLSHAVGCAFAVCLEKKQQREKEAVSVSYNDDKTSFSRLGSFRQATLTERLADPQSTKVIDPTSAASASTAVQVEVTAKVERPQASQDLLMRQGSFREFTKLNSQTSPFKRNLSLRLNELPSNLSRQQNFTAGSVPHVSTVPILEQDEDAAQATSPLDHLDKDITDIPVATQKADHDPIAELCRQVSQGMQGVHAQSSGLVNGSSPLQPTQPAQPPAGVPAAQDPNNPWAPTTQFWLPTTSTTTSTTSATPSLVELAVATNNDSSTTANGSTARPRPAVQSPPVAQSALFLQNNFTHLTNEPPKNNNVTNGITVTPLSANQTASTNPFDTSWAVKTNNPNNPFLATTQSSATPTTNAHQQFSKEFELKM